MGWRPAELGTSSLFECPAHPWEGHHTPLGYLVADPSAATGTLPGTAKQEDLTRTHCKQKHPPHPPEFQSHGHLYSTSHSSVGFSRMCSKCVLNGCLPNSHTMYLSASDRGAWPYKPAACHCLALRDLGRMECRELVKDPGLMSTVLSPR